MKIAHLIEAGRFGGPNRTILEICKALHDEHEFIVISGEENSRQFRSELDLLNIKSYFLPLTRLRLNLYVFFRYVIKFPYEISMIYKTLKSEQIDIIHNHTYLDFKGIIVGRLLNKPVVWHLHSSVLPKKIKPLFLFFLKIHRGSLICVSQLTKDVFLGDKFNAYTRIVQSPVDTDLFFPQQKTDIDNKLDKTISLCSVANFHSDKGQKILIEAFPILLKLGEKNNLKFTLHLKGNIYKNQKVYYEGLVNLVNKYKMENSIFFDSNRENKVNIFLNDKNIFVLASKAEASPISVWEAAAMGIPIICTDVGDVKYYIEQYDCGKILNDENHEELAKLILNLCLSANFTKMCYNAREMALKEFSFRKIKNAYLKIYYPLQPL